MFGGNKVLFNDYPPPPFPNPPPHALTQPPNNTAARTMGRRRRSRPRRHPPLSSHLRTRQPTPLAIRPQSLWHSRVPAPINHHRLPHHHPQPPSPQLPLPKPPHPTLSFSPIPSPPPSAVSVPPKAPTQPHLPLPLDSHLLSHHRSSMHFLPTSCCHPSSSSDSWHYRRPYPVYFPRHKERS